MTTDSAIDKIVAEIDPFEVWKCDIGLVRETHPDARRFLLVVSDFMCPPIDGIAIVLAHSKRFGLLRDKVGSFVEVALRGARLVYKKPFVTPD